MTFSGPNWKPAKGTALLERRTKQRQLDAHEKAEKAKVRKRDQSCRWPGCGCRALRMPLEVAHLRSKSLGGPSDTADMMLLCRLRHQGAESLHSQDLRIEPLTPNGADGPCAFYRLRESGRWECIGVESTIGISETRGL